MPGKGCTPLLTCGHGLTLLECDSHATGVNTLLRVGAALVLFDKSLEALPLISSF